MSEWAVGQEIGTPELLEQLPVGARILDTDLVATKTASGAWLYAHDSKYWEPQQFPCIILELP